MDEMENKLNAILGNPEMMSKIMSLAQNFSQNDTTPKEDPPVQPPSQGELPPFDLSMLQKLSGYAKQSGIDKNQQTLLRSLSPYLSHQRIAKLEKAMRAAKMANMATAFLGRSQSTPSR